MKNNEPTSKKWKLVQLIGGTLTFIPLMLLVLVMVIASMTTSAVGDAGILTYLVGWFIVYHGVQVCLVLSVVGIITIITSQILMWWRRG